MIIKDYLVNQIDGLNICKDTFYFDIETLGLSPKIHPIILICAAFYDSDETVLIRQYFCETLNEEKDILLAFSNDINGKSICITFNGNAFDLPFIKRRFECHSLTNNLSDINSYDILAFMKPLKKIWKLDNLKLKTIEAFFNIHRKDIISGKESILMYKDYKKNNNMNLRDKVLLHNYEDVKNLILLNAKIKDLLTKQSIYIETKYGKILVHIYDYKINKSKIKIIFKSISRDPTNLSPSLSIFKNNGDNLVQNSSSLEMNVFFKIGIDNNNRKILYLEINSNLLPVFIDDELIEKNVFYLLRSFFYE